MNNGNIQYKIYIPLCFYFIICLALRHASAMAHLHSTMLLLYLIRRRTGVKRNKFTFHYASTLSQLEKKVEKHNSDLHSTMLLLYLNLNVLIVSSYFHLHSTMLLLYHRSSPVVHPGGSHLHSTMLLLYPSPDMFIFPNPSNLHSTMLLLYLISGRTSFTR